jgi:phage terminase large subunit
MTAVRAHMWAEAGEEGIILCGRQFMNSLADSSLEEVKAAIQETDWLRPHFEIGDKYVRTICGRINYAFSGLDRNINSIKSKSRIRLCWVDEAEPVTEDAWSKLDPTLREEDSELWVTWNPERKTSATNKRFGNSTDPRTRIVEMNWRDNPWFPAILERKRLKDLNERPDQYEHVWEGAFKTVYEGAYFAKELAKAKAENRIGFVTRDPNMQVRTFWDLGRRDHTAIWVAQWVGQKINLIDHIEGSGQGPGFYFEELRQRGYRGCMVYLPHDGARVGPENSTGRSYEDQAREAGFDVQVIMNQGQSAAMLRVDAARRVFPRMWFDETKTEGGREALAAYHERRDDKREIGLGPEHDWSSHSADAFGLMCVAYEEPQVKREAARRPQYTPGDGWADERRRYPQGSARSLHRVRERRAPQPHRGRADIRFARLEEQWPPKSAEQREREGRPCLTVNKLPAFIRQVVNDSRQNRRRSRCCPRTAEPTRNRRGDERADPQHRNHLRRRRGLRYRR